MLEGKLSKKLAPCCSRQELLSQYYYLLWTLLRYTRTAILLSTIVQFLNFIITRTAVSTVVVQQHMPHVCVSQHTHHTYAYICDANTRIQVVRTNLLCDSCCTAVAVRTRCTHTTHIRIHDDHTCIPVVHTRILVVCVAVSSSSKQSKNKEN